jgi:hypothetical protein
MAFHQDALYMHMQEVLATLRSRMKFKSGTKPGDLILIGMQPGIFYGIVQSIIPNVKRDWFDFSFKLLLVPPVDVTWVLRIPQMTGEIFTMNGKEHFIVAVDAAACQQSLAMKKSRSNRSNKMTQPALRLVKHIKVEEE